MTSKVLIPKEQQTNMLKTKLERTKAILKLLAHIIIINHILFIICSFSFNFLFMLPLQIFKACRDINNQTNILKSICKLKFRKTCGGTDALFLQLANICTVHKPCSYFYNWQIFSPFHTWLLIYFCL